MHGKKVPLVLSYHTTRRHAPEYSKIHIRNLKASYLAIAKYYRVANYDLKMKKLPINQKKSLPLFCRNLKSTILYLYFCTVHVVIFILFKPTHALFLKHIHIHI